MKTYKSGDGIFFTSDTHFNHANIIKYCNRPFKTVEEMNNYLVNAWNAVVKPEDTIFHLGDFAFGGSQVWNDYAHKLNGHKILILGNHDIKNIRQGFMSLFDDVEYQMKIKIEDRVIYLNHFPLLCFDGSYKDKEYATWQLFGHVHTPSIGLDSDRVKKNKMPNQYDVGVDNNNFAPVSWKKLNQIIDKQYEEFDNNRLPKRLYRWLFGSSGS